MRAAVDKLGAVGLIKDKEPTSLPPNAWTDLSNIECKDGSIYSVKGYESIGTISDLPETLAQVRSVGVDYIVYAAQDKIYAYAGGTETEIGTGLSTLNTWDSTILGGVAIFTNFQDNPQYWGGSGNTVDLPYDETGTETCLWTDVEMKARLIRTFRYHLFALDVEDCDGYNPRKVHWSHPAEPGSIPITWDPTKADFDAGFVELSQTPGPIVDALQMRDTLQIYKTDGIWSVTYTGRFSVGEPIFNFRVVTTSRGLYARNCVCDIGGKHFFVSDGDIYLTDGTNFQSLADQRVRDDFFDNVSRSNKELTFVTFDERTGKVWLCYPEAGDTACTKAFIWDSNENTWSKRDIPGSSAAAFVVVPRGSQKSWADLADDYGSWADWGDDPNWTYWTEPVDQFPFRESLVLGGPTDLYEMERGNQAGGVNITCQAQRTHLDLGDKADWHMVLTLYPRAQGDPFSVRVGSVDVSGSSTTWSDYQTFTPGVSYKLDFRVTGRQHSVEFYSNADVSWNVEGYEIDYAQAGRR